MVALGNGIAIVTAVLEAITLSWVFFFSLPNFENFVLSLRTSCWSEGILVDLDSHRGGGKSSKHNERWKHHCQLSKS